MKLCLIHILKQRLCFCYLQLFLLIQTYYPASISVFKLSLGPSPHLSAPLPLPTPLLPPPMWSFA